MSGVKGRCPCCGVGLTPLAPLPAQVECPVCGHRFALAGPVSPPLRRPRRAVWWLSLALLSLLSLWWFLPRPPAPAPSAGTGTGGLAGEGSGPGPDAVPSPASEPVPASGPAHEVVVAPSPNPVEQEVWGAAVARALKLCKRRGQAEFPPLGSPGTALRRGADGVYTVEGYFLAPDRAGKSVRVRFVSRIRAVPHGFESELPAFE